MEEKIKEVLNTIRPYLQSDGGNIEFIRYEDNYVYVKMTGACQGCDFLENTLEGSILAALQSEIPEIEGIINLDL